eukprot:Gregarina_sp_Poly_1__11518@NODE_999_length_5423_cov_682_617625_g701_i0_p4_GENE_NODE_999_length_5423_cov_682_617625_g701_i0NODE_999_length_5423_cov_682_617625_g701_i0_p4_ORF_typecomplete_len217_score29_83TMEM208_SND2/PF05620_11/2_1TMEM208_SND2/PF05620_11/38_NODE_999_length_5423_cov_682_617625_g701_i021592809
MSLQTADSTPYQSEEEWQIDSPEAEVFVPSTYAALPALFRRLATSLHWKRAMRNLNVAALFLQGSSLIASFVTACPRDVLIKTWMILTSWIFLQLFYWALVDLVRNRLGAFRTCEGLLLRLEFWVAVFAVVEASRLVYQWPDSHLQYTIVSIQLMIVLLSFCKMSQADLNEADQLLLNSKLLDCKETLPRESEVWRDNENSARDMPYYHFDTDARL